ncbi:hypothetical protein FIBSPDRAFT_896817 [Athelia psychrophila]|uniref:Nephrocystin 3-like N-terminal domain-containing protein n=1 Tax=Athelia psychrophila TaxID=1759441 RepID=A0A166D0Q2_9AGAM|nr:hypothetical protein FIBSPDRAFT_896817 [Fibularhizoctonia sp. CBS 109695]
MPMHRLEAFKQGLETTATFIHNRGTKDVVKEATEGVCSRAVAGHYVCRHIYIHSLRELLVPQETPDSALWVYGTRCGKTTICSTVIEDICEECAATPNFALAYFFFDSRNAQTDLSLYDRLIRSIIKQLSSAIS